MDIKRDNSVLHDAPEPRQQMGRKLGGEQIKWRKNDDSGSRDGKQRRFGWKKQTEENECVCAVWKQSNEVLMCGMNQEMMPESRDGE